MTAKYGSSMPSHHDPSSHFNNVRSFSPVVGAKAAETAYAQRCPDVTSQTALQRDSKSQQASPDVEDRFGSSQIQTSMVTPPQLGQQPDSPKSAPRGHEVPEMQTPPLLGTGSGHTPPEEVTGSDLCRCNQSTPMPGHEAQEVEYSFTSQGATKDEFSGLASLTRRQD